MAFADPQSVTIATVANSLPRVPDGFQKVDGLVKLTISHNPKKGQYDSVMLTVNKVTSDPIVPSQNIRATVNATISVKRSTNAVDMSADALNVAKALRDWATDANLTKLLGGEA